MVTFIDQSSRQFLPAQPTMCWPAKPELHCFQAALVPLRLFLMQVEVEVVRTIQWW